MSKVQDERFAALFPKRRPAAARYGLRYEVIKTLMDKAFAFAGLILCLPLFAALAILIKCNSRGPVFFRQRRIGKHGKTFTLWKFRTMRASSQAYAIKPSSDSDPSITRVGSFLRRRGLDELPQLLCVLTGRMSLVGPRPEMPFIVETYTAQQRARLSVTPGITGFWQVAGPKHEPIQANLQYDLYYIQNRSLQFDAWILMQTLRILLGFRRRPARQEEALPVPQDY
jgi:lipopolysaccharide/colanic/teichoic acid biosynthesis glycosyltransferase